MNTLQSRPAMIELNRRRDYIILLETLEFAMPESQLEAITTLHNQGVGYKEISKRVKRNKYEVIIALLHQVKSGIAMRPFAFMEVDEDDPSNA